VAQNDGPLLTFESGGQGEGTFLQVRLAGRPGNPRGIGARITAVLASGEQRVHEVRAGGGYLSQSSATAFLSVGKQVVERVIVRWPDGKLSEVAEVPDEPLLVVAP